MNFPAVPTHDPTAFPSVPITPVYILPQPVKTTKEELLKVINRIYYEFYAKYIRSCKMDADATALNEELKRFTRDYNDPNYYNRGGRINKTSKSMPGNPRKKKNQKTKKRKN